MIPIPPISTLFPYTTHFRSQSLLLLTLDRLAPLTIVVTIAHQVFHTIMDTFLYSVVVALSIPGDQDRKSTRLNSSHVAISYAVFCLKKKKDDSVEVAVTSIA